MVALFAKRFDDFAAIRLGTCLPYISKCVHVMSMFIDFACMQPLLKSMCVPKCVNVDAMCFSYESVVASHVDTCCKRNETVSYINHKLIIMHVYRRMTCGEANINIHVKLELLRNHKNNTYISMFSKNFVLKRVGPLGNIENNNSIRIIQTTFNHQSWMLLHVQWFRATDQHYIHCFWLYITMFANATATLNGFDRVSTF
jgi:hypothetical protein